MSLSQPKPVNPCKKFIEFKGNSGVFQYWDKSTEKNIEVEKPVKFIVLDELATITGFSDQFQCGVYSNEVHSLTNELMSVRTFKGGQKIVGKYADIKGEIASMGGKFCKSVYAALIGKGNVLELVNFQLKGAALSAWVNYSGDKTGGAVQVIKCMDGKKGAVTYKIPVFEQVTYDPDLMKQAIMMDRNLQAYLADYAQHNLIKAETEQPDAPVESQEHPKDGEIPF